LLLFVPDESLLHRKHIEGTDALSILCRNPDGEELQLLERVDQAACKSLFFRHKGLSPILSKCLTDLLKETCVDRKMLRILCRLVFKF
jgi:hypothetical protein